MNPHASSGSLGTDYDSVATERESVYGRITIDFVTALTAAITVSPIVAAVDKYVSCIHENLIDITDAIAMKSSRRERNQK